MIDNSLKFTQARTPSSMCRRLSSVMLGIAFLSASLVAGHAATLAVAPSAASQNATGQQPRRPLPKPKSGARGFEQYAGRDASSRLISAGATRSTGIPRKPVAPLEGIALDARPFFLWEPAPNTQAYKFMLYDGDVYQDAKAPMIWQTETAQPQLRYPADAPALKPGHLYSWRVAAPQSAIRNGNSGSLTMGTPVNFFILIDEDAQPVKRTLADAKLDSARTVGERLKHAQSLVDYGVWYDALRMARELLADNPQNADVQAFYESLIGSLEQ